MVDAFNKAFGKFALAKEVRHEVFGAFPEVCRHHGIDACISEYSKFVVFCRQVYQDPVSVFGLVHLQRLKNLSRAVQNRALATAFDVYLNLSRGLGFCLFYCGHDLCLLLWRK